MFPCSGTLKTHKIIAFNDVLWITKKVGTDHFGIVCYGFPLPLRAVHGNVIEELSNVRRFAASASVAPLYCKIFFADFGRKTQSKFNLYIIEVDV